MFSTTSNGNDPFGLSWIPSAPSCLTCHDDDDNDISPQALVDQLNAEIHLECDEKLIMTTPTNSLVVDNNDAPLLEACDSSISTFSRQESISAKSDDTPDLHIHDCISKDRGNGPKDGDSELSSEEEEDDLPPVLTRRASLIRLISNCSLGDTESPHCPICLDPMTPIDHQHPLQCPTRHCHFNFCASCINSLLSSSKDDFEMASDGNAHVKIYLNCPNCRADLSTTIRDVLLLRKVDTVLWLQAQRTRSTELSASQQRTRQAMRELHVQEAIQEAREKEVTFWKTHHSLLYGKEEEEQNNDDGEHKEDSCYSRRRSSRLESSRKLLDGSFHYEEEWGVEADIDNGVHSSFRMPTNEPLLKTSSTKKDDKKKDFAKHASVDETLLQGLEGLMLHAEQLDVSHWMTSGKPNELAKAAEMLRQIEEDARQGVKPADRQKLMNRRASVFEIVAESRAILEEGPAKPKSAPSIMGGYTHRMTPRQRQALLQQQKIAEHKQQEMALAAKASLLQRCPLPVRMPKAIILELRHDPLDRRFPLRFCNDNWDGTVLDAYTKISVVPASRRRLASASDTPKEPWTVSKKPQGQHPGVFNVLSQGRYQRHYGAVELTMEQPARVLVASVQGTAGRQGVMKGDVVTHVDGEPLQGKTVDDLVELLRTKREGQSEVKIVLNAEPSIAEALKRRSKVMEN